MRRFLALDVGKKRTGIALVDDSAKVATPITVIAHEPTTQPFLKELAELVEQWEPVGLIFGLPIDLKGKEAIAATSMRQLADQIIKKINESRSVNAIEPLEHHFVDERLTTAQAERAMRDASMDAKTRKKLRDAMAAALIAQSFVDTL